MDRVQELLEHVREGKMSGPTSSTAAPSATPSPAPPKRTKKVFVYSDEDDEADAPESVTAGVAEVSCEALAIPVSEDALAELRADAHAIDAGEHDSADDDDDSGLFFCEDVLSGLGAAASAPALTASVLGSAGGGAESGRAGRMRVREVDAPTLWDGALGVASAAADDAAEAEEEMPALLRRGLPAATFVLESRRKRFRDTEAEGERAGSTVPTAHTVQLPSAAAAAATHSTAAEPTVVAAAAPSAAVGSCTVEEGGDSEEEVEVIKEVVDLRPVYDEDGETVRAVQTRGGYVLTLDERDLLEGEDEEGEDCEGEDGDATAAAADAVDATTPADHAAPSSPSALEEAAETADVDVCNDDLDDLFDDEDDDDDEEEEEMDEAIVVAVVEQLVRCCEADDLDPQMALEATRFQASAKPLLADLTEERISPKEFGQKIDRDLRRFQRIYRSVYRPRDSPIVIDGVQMDM